MGYWAEVVYGCGHRRSTTVQSSFLSGRHHRAIKCRRCRLKDNLEAAKIKRLSTPGEYGTTPVTKETKCPT